MAILDFSPRGRRSAIIKREEGDSDADGKTMRLAGLDEVTYPGTLGRFLTVQVLRHLGRERERVISISHPCVTCRTLKDYGESMHPFNLFYPWRLFLYLLTRIFKFAQSSFRAILLNLPANTGL